MFNKIISHRHFLTKIGALLMLLALGRGIKSFEANVLTADTNAGTKIIDLMPDYEINFVSITSGDESPKEIN